MAYEPDTWSLGDRTFTSRFILGSGKFNLDLVEAAVRDAGAEIVTLAVRRANTGQDGSILDAIPEGVTLLPNTSGARTADEAVRIARLARAMGCGDFVKVEVIRDAAYLMPDNAETVRATAQLVEEGFVVLPYMFPDLVCARDLVRAGAAAVMPLAAPIGSNKGLAARDFIKITLDRVRVDAGNAAALFAGERIVCEAFDDPRCKADLVNALLTEAPNTGVVAGSGMAGAGPADALVTRRVGRRLFVCGDGEADVADEALFAPRVALCAAQQALVVVRLVLGLEGN